MTSKSDKRRRYAGRSQQPKGFDTLLKAINSVNHLADFPDHRQLLSVIEDWLEKHKWVSRYIEKRISRPLVFDEAPAGKDFLRMIAYGAFLDERRKVLSILEANEKKNEPRGVLTNYVIAIGFDEEGLLVQMPDEFLRMVLNTEVFRLRRCGLCEKIFWASRKDMQGCSQKCSDVLRKRKARVLLAEKAAEYEANRAAKEQKGKSK